MLICKTYRFSASHQLKNLPDGHPCLNLHGHNYKIDVAIRGEINRETGMILDFHDLDDLMEPYINQYLDHVHLNNVLPLPTCEYLAMQIYDFLHPEIDGLEYVRVWETENSFAEFSG